MGGWGWKYTLFNVTQVLNDPEQPFLKNTSRWIPQYYLDKEDWHLRNGDAIIDSVNLYKAKSSKNICERVPFCLTHFFLEATALLRAEVEISVKT